MGLMGPPNTMSDHLSSLSFTLPSFLNGQLSTDEFVRQWRAAAHEHTPALPARFLLVLDHLLSQLESAALFSEESCSFSRRDMVASLEEWLNKALAL